MLYLSALPIFSRKSKPDQTRPRKTKKKASILSVGIKTFRWVARRPDQKVTPKRPSAQQGKQEAPGVRRCRLAAPARKSRARGAVTFASDPIFSIAWAPNCAMSSRFSTPDPFLQVPLRGWRLFGSRIASFQSLAAPFGADSSTAGPRGTRELRFAPGSSQTRGRDRAPDWALLKTSRHGRPLEPIPVSNPSGEAPAPNHAESLRLHAPRRFSACQLARVRA